jgi:Ca2+/H+ antiporter
VLGLSWLLFCIPVLAFYGVIPGASLPVEVFALASTLLILLPTALWITSITDGRAGVRALFARVPLQTFWQAGCEGMIGV